MTSWLIITVIITSALLVPLAVVIWNILGWRRVTAVDATSPQPLVSVLIPARNEAANLPACIAAVQQQGAVVAEIIVLDDHSHDRTAAVVRQLKPTEPRLQLITGQSLPDGWVGKCWACQQLGAAATAEWLLFLDADARLVPGAIAGMLSVAKKLRLSMLSCWPGFSLHSFWEQLLMPLLNFLTFTLYPAPLALLRMSDASLGLAHGACLLLRRGDYLALGGHRVVKHELFEDTRLARAWRASGRRSLGLDGQDVVRVRMYQSLPQIWVGFEKNFYPAFKQPLGFALFLGVHVALFLLPFPLVVVALAAGSPALLLWLSFAACSMVLAMRLLLAWRFQHPYWSALLHPLGELLLVTIALNSWWRVASGRGVRWKGRSYLGATSSGKQDHRQ